MKPDDTRRSQMQAVADHAYALFRLKPDRVVDIRIEYVCEDEAGIMSRTTPWERSYHHVRPGAEYFMIWETEHNDLLYVVEVTADSVLTAAWELLSLMSRKF